MYIHTQLRTLRCYPFVGRTMQIIYSTLTTHGQSYYLGVLLTRCLIRPSRATKFLILCDEWESWEKLNTRGAVQIIIKCEMRNATATAKANANADAKSSSTRACGNDEWLAEADLSFHSESAGSVASWRASSRAEKSRERETKTIKERWNES